MKKRLIVCVLVLSLALCGCSQLTSVLSVLGLEPPYIEVTVDESVFEERFYYAQYSEADQLIYREIYQGLIQQEKEICVHSSDADHCNTIFHTVIFDFPELFWTDGSGVSTTYDGTYTEVKPNYQYTGAEKEKMESEIESAVTGIVSGIPAEYGEYDKIKYVYEYMVNSIAYVEDAPDNQNIYSSLVRKETVCAGYAKATQYVLQRLGIYCAYVIGDATGPNGVEGHAWNMVQCNGQYYYVDTTWADPYYANSGSTSDEVIYDYLCCSESTISGTHIKDKNYIYPECNSDDLNYYRLNGLYYETASESQLMNAMKASINGKKTETIFKFANADLYGKAHNALVNRLVRKAAEYLGQRYGLRQVHYSYSEISELNKFIVYWKYQ